MTQTIELPARIDRAAARMLAAEILACRSADIILDGQSVEQIATPGLQVLMSATRQWAADAHAISLVRPSAVLRDALCRLGIPVDAISMEKST